MGCRVSIIEVQSLSVRYRGGITALDRIDLAFEPGAFTVLLGPSGAGKSTLLRALNGLVRPTRGKVVSAEIGVLNSRAKLRRHRRAAAMIFQQHQLIGRLNVLTNVLTGRLGFYRSWQTLYRHGGADMRRALEAIDRVGLLDYALRRVDMLSGGQQQRVGIARALAQDPTLVLGDEPIASLDPETSIRVLKQLHDICKADGITAIVSLHQVDLAKQFADRLIGISAGQVVFDGQASELTADIVQRIYGAQGSERDTEHAVGGTASPSPAAVLEPELEG